MMYGRGKSSPVIVAGKPANKADPDTVSAAESVERRTGAKGNANQHATYRTQRRARVVAPASIRQAARLDCQYPRWEPYAGKLRVRVCAGGARQLASLPRLQRREFITLLGGAAAAWSLAGRAQQPAKAVIGFLHSLSPQAVATRVAAFRQGFRDSGYVEGRDLEIEFRWAQGQYERLPELARELVGRRVAAIVAATSPAAVAAKAATSAIPIIFTSVGGDPVDLGLVPSLNRPGSNITGVSILTSALVPKRLELLGELVPNATTIAALVNPANPNAERTVREMTSAARALGRRLVVATAGTEPDFEAAFGIFIRERAGALLVDSDPFFFAQRYRLAALAARHALASVYELRDFAAAGGLMSYGPNNDDSYRQAAFYTTRILKGEKPADLPVTQPTKFEFVINLQTAKALGIHVPATFLVRADEVIE